MAAGGEAQGGGNPTNVHELFHLSDARPCVPAGSEPANDLSYTAIASQPFSVSEAQGEAVDGRLYTFGGFGGTQACCIPTARSYVYPAADTWTPIADLPYVNDGSVTHAGMATDGTDIYMVGGYISNAANTGQIFGTKEAYRYNVATDTYTRLPDLPVERSGGQVEYLDGKLHYFGGTNLARTQDTDDHWTLDVAGGADTWQARADLPNPRHHLGSAVVDGEIYAIGGQHGHDGALVPEDDVHVYDPTSDSWAAAQPLPEARNHVSNSTFLMDGRIVVAGGQASHGDSKASVYAYDAAADTWAALTPLPAARHSGVAGHIGDGFVFSGGGTAAGWRAAPR